MAASADKRHRVLGLFNSLAGRTLFLEQALEALEALNQHPQDRGFAVLAFDIDRYTLVSDTFGFDAADELLAVVAGRLSDSVALDHTLAQLGDHEFAVLLKGVGTEAAAMAEAVRIQGVLQRPCTLLGTHFHVCASTGVALANPSYPTVERLVTDAMVASHEAQHGLPGRVKFYTDPLLIQRNQQLNLDSELREALKLGQIQPHFQPLVGLADGRTHGFEALARWTHPELGSISPAKFIPLAEETGLIQTLGSLMLDLSLEQAARWRGQHAPDLFVSVNVSAAQLATDSFVDEVIQRLDEHGLSADALHLEITESILVADPERTRACLQRLTAHGVRISLDDFGTGYSAFSSLHQFPIHTLKIDRSLLPKDAVDSRQRLLFDALCALAAKLGLAVVVEGVETQDQASVVRQATPGLGQGFLWSRALAPQDVPAWMQRSAA